MMTYFSLVQTKIFFFGDLTELGETLEKCDGGGVIVLVAVMKVLRMYAGNDRL